MSLAKAQKKTDTESTPVESPRVRIDRIAKERRDRYIRERNQRGRSATNIAAMQKLKVHDYGGQTEGHHCTWVNDYPGNIESYLERGYSPVLKDGLMKIGDRSEDYNSDLGTWVSAYVGKDDNGKPLRGYLLKIPMEWYNEDERERHKRLDEVERQIYGERMQRNLNLKNMKHIKRKPDAYYPEPDDKGIYPRHDMNRFESKPLGEE